MKTLWTLGDSFTSDFTQPHENHKKYMEIVGVNEIMTWPHVLGNKLEMNVRNLGKGGNSNYEIFQKFCDISNDVDEGDTVIIGWGLVSKFRIVSNNEFHNIYPDPNGEYRNIVLNREDDKWCDEIYSWENLIKGYSKLKKFNILFWSGEEHRLNHKYSIYKLMEMGCSTMRKETNEVVSDSHFGISGHIKQAEIFYKELNHE
jgi:hypothetical protein